MCLALLMPSALNAKPRTLQQKMQAATAAFSKGQLSKMMKAKKAPMKQLKAADDYTVFGYDNGGFAIIANDDLLPAVLGYSESSFDDKAKNENFKWWLNAVSEVAKKKCGKRQGSGSRHKANRKQFPRGSSDAPHHTVGTGSTVQQSLPHRHGRLGQMSHGMRRHVHGSGVLLS